MVKKKGIIAVMILAGALALSGCQNAANSNGSAAGNSTKEGIKEETVSTEGTENVVDSEDLTPIKIAAASATAQLSENAILAQNLGYFDEELAKIGYKPEYVGFAQAGPAINEAFAAGEIDYAFYGDFAAITAKSNSVDIKVIGMANQEMNYALLVTEKSGISSIKDIEGKKIIVPSGTVLYKYFIDECEKNGIDPANVEQINALADAQSLLASGDADGLITAYSAALLYANMGLGKVAENSTSDLKEASGLVLAGRADFVEDNPEVNKALLRALNRSAAYIKENSEDAYELMKTEGTSVEVLEQTYSYDTSYEYFSPALSDTYLERAEGVYEFSKEKSLIGEEFDLKDLFDSTYVDEVLAE